MKSRNILVIIVFAQFCCTSLWFASNGVMTDLIPYFDLPNSSVGLLTSIVQLGFISGTLIFAILTLADRYSPSKVFFVCAILAALFNLMIIWDGNNYYSLLLWRFCVGFFLAGIYPVGMKIAADHFDKALGKSLGYLVGALVLGTALPHLLKDLTNAISWKSVFVTTSSLAFVGGVLMYALIPDGPYRKVSQQTQFSAFYQVFKNRNFRAAAFGYFGHMWELYAFWTFLPIIIVSFNAQNASDQVNQFILCFATIGVGGIACILGGYLSQKYGEAKMAFSALLLSCICCLLSPLIFIYSSKIVFVTFLIFWGMVVAADSPLFSTLVAQNADSKRKGTALTIVTCIGFAITIFSIQLLGYLQDAMDIHYIFTLLAIGPILGLMALYNNSKKNLSQPEKTES